jgi:signal transduction histidine kinase
VAEEAGVALRVHIEPNLRVLGSRELIGQTIANLIDNALKYGAPEPVVRLDAPGAAMTAPLPSEVALEVRRVGDDVEISVADHGPGIAIADRARVLDRFVRLEGARSRPGSGLGLSLAAAVARMHAGSVRLEDNRPGLRVIVALPLTKGAAPALAREAALLTPALP